MDHEPLSFAPSQRYLFDTAILSVLPLCCLVLLPVRRRSEQDTGKLQICQDLVNSARLANARSAR